MTFWFNTQKGAVQFEILPASLKFAYLRFDGHIGQGTLSLPFTDVDVAVHREYFAQHIGLHGESFVGALKTASIKHATR
jgi:hypothetical protein